MSVLPIHIAPDPILRQKAKRVRRIDPSIDRLIDEMIETMHAAPGVGLAAPQVGVSLRVVVIETHDDGLFTLINPEIVKHSGERLVMEGCLSVPGYQAEITRSRTVRAKAIDRDGHEIRVKAPEDSLLAQALQHEIDHINGILYVDHIKPGGALIPVRPSIDDGDERSLVEVAAR